MVRTIENPNDLARKFRRKEGKLIRIKLNEDLGVFFGVERRAVARPVAFSSYYDKDGVVIEGRVERVSGDSVIIHGEIKGCGENYHVFVEYPSIAEYRFN